MANITNKKITEITENFRKLKCMGTNDRKLNVKLVNRIYNGKFSTATRYFKDESKEAKELVFALSNIFGNIGWINRKKDIEDWVCWEDVHVKDLLVVMKHALENIGCEKNILNMFSDEDKEG